MVEQTRRKGNPWVLENGFDSSPPTIKEVAKATGMSSHSVKENVVQLLKVLPVRERILVLEHMSASKERKFGERDAENAQIGRALP